MAIQYESTGGIGTGTDFSVDVPYPSVVNADDILIAAIMDTDDDSFDVPTDWNKIDEQTDHSNLSVAYYWKRATGSESGTETFTSLANAGSLVAGIMYRYSGCVTSGTPVEGDLLKAVVSGSNTGLAENGGASSGSDRLALCFAIVEDNTITSFSGGVVVYNEDSRLDTSIGSDAHFGAASVTISTSNHRLPYWQMSSSEYYSRISFFLIPAASAAVTDVAINIGDSWKLMAGMKINIGGVWKTVSAIKKNIGGTWKDVLTLLLLLSLFYGCSIVDDCDCYIVKLDTDTYNPVDMVQEAWKPYKYDCSQGDKILRENDEIYWIKCN